MPDFKIDKLNKLYEAGKRIDEELFSEMRTNILLKNSKHYSKKNQVNSLITQLRSKGVVDQKTKIRLTKNHIHRITNTYENAIISGNPSATAVPFNKDELSDVKQAEMSNDIIAWVKKTNKWKQKRAKLVNDYSVIGEVFAKIRFDTDLGPAVKDENGEQAKDEAGNPRYAGEFVIDRVFAFDIKRDPAARDWDEVRWLIQEQMVDMDEFKQLLKSSDLAKEQKEKVGNLTNSTKNVIKVFDANTGTYKDVKNQYFVKELYYKPSPLYPNGWFVMWVEDVKLFEGELPFGIWPWEQEGFDELTTSPRSAAIIRVCRPYQVEINRASSKVAEHQVTLGDDKVYIQKGTKISSGGYLHGVRAIQVTGSAPIVQQGRTGEQYVNYVNGQISEMYEAVNLSHVLQEKTEQGGDPYQKLFESMKHKLKFVKYAEKWEDFEVRIWEKVLKMARRYLDASHVIRASGRSEIVNIQEFLETDNDGFEISLVPQSGDIETKFGRILSATAVLQYAGGSLDPDQLGSVIRQLPLGNDEQILSTLTINSDNAMNDILALDRGEKPEVSPSADHVFMIKALDHRKRKSDFKFMSDEIKENYEIQIRTHEAFKQQAMMIEAQAQAGQIPTGGFLTTVNASWFNPTTGRVERVKVPSQAIEWVVQKLNTQGHFAQELSQMPLESQARLTGGGTAQAPTLPGLGEQPQAAVVPPTGTESPQS